MGLQCPRKPLLGCWVSWTDSATTLHTTQFSLYKVRHTRCILTHFTPQAPHAPLSHKIATNHHTRKYHNRSVTKVSRLFSARDAGNKAEFGTDYAAGGQGEFPTSPTCFETLSPPDKPTTLPCFLAPCVYYFVFCLLFSRVF